MKKLVLISILVISIFLAGCAGEKAATTTSAKTSSVEKVTYKTPESFADSFVKLWNDENYGRMYPMFVSSLTGKISKEQFVYLFGRDFKNVASVKQTYYNQKDPSTVKFSVLVTFDDKDTKRVSLMKVVKKDSEWRISDLEQYFGVIEYCETTLNKDTCVYDFANKFKEQDWCKNAGIMFNDCYESLGIDLTVSQIKEICSDYSKTVASEAECYKVLAYEDDNDFYCSAIQILTKKYECYGNLAAKKEDVSVCEILQYEQQLSERTKSYAYCIAGYVEKTGDVSKCDLITGTDLGSTNGKKICLNYG